MALITIIPAGAAPSGTFTSPVQTIASDPSARTLLLQVLSNDWTTGESGLVISFEVDLSTDGGVTFNPVVIGTTVGGAVNSRTGGLPSIDIGLAANQAYKLKASATLNQPATSIGLAYNLS